MKAIFCYSSPEDATYVWEMDVMQKAQVQSAVIKRFREQLSVWSTPHAALL